MTRRSSGNYGTARCPAGAGGVWRPTGCDRRALRSGPPGGARGRQDVGFERLKASSAAPLANARQTRPRQLTLLAPDFVEAILDGRQRAEMQLDDLLVGFPLARQRQRSHFGRHPMEENAPALPPGSAGVYSRTSAGGRATHGDAMILVTGATGTSGRELIRRLSEMQVAFKAMVRKDADREALEAQGVAAVVADYRIPNGCRRP